MSATVIQLDSAADAAWARYREHIARSFTDRSLLLDRDFMEEWARRERVFKRLFNATEGTR